MSPTAEPAAPVPDLRLELTDSVGQLVFDRPDSSVNLLTREVMLGLEQLIGRVEDAVARGAVRAVVVRSAKPDTFIAGADIDELAAFDDSEEATEVSRRGQKIFLRLERLGVPTLAAVRGDCLGGGLELALACAHRVAADHPRTRLGLPETRLGILPGLGGTVRLPRLVGLRRALDLILSGRHLSARRAASIGLVDEVVEPADFDARVDAIGAELARGGSPLERRAPPLWTRLLVHRPPGRWVIAGIARKRVRAETGGHYPAPPTALDVTTHGLGRSIERAHEEEARAFGALAVTPVCKNLIAVFRLTRSARKRGPAGTAREVDRAVVVGAGVMGSGIAELFAYQKIPTRVIDIDRTQVDEGLQRARRLLGRAGRQREWSPEDLRERTECLSGDTGYADLEDVDLAIEAVVERMDVKREVFRALEESLPDRAVIATNTSALSVSELASVLRDPGRACGLHFFNPPHRMPLVELVRGALTTDDTLATAFQAATRLGKTPVVVRDRPGFAVNRILGVYLTEAGHLVQEGLTIEDVDETMDRFGMPMGPLRLLDEIGLDVVAEVSRTLEDGLGPRFRPAPVMARVLETGRTGRKGGHGFYRYEDGEPREVDPEVARLVAESAGGRPPDRSAAEERMVLGMVNEAARALDDDVVDSAADIDVAMIMGAGFPPFRGGLLRYADSLGLAHITARLRHYAEAVAPRFEPSAALTERRAFYDS